MEVTNGVTASSFLERLRIVSGFFKLRDAATSLAGGLWRGVFGFQEEEDEDLEAGPTEETNVQTITSIEQFETVPVKTLMPTFPAIFIYFTLPGLLCLGQIKWQLAPLGFPSSALHNWYIICVTSLLTEFVASIAQWIIFAAGGP